MSLFTKTKEIIIIDIINPKSSFHKKLVKSFNGCRIKALKKWFPELDDYDIDSLLDDNYIEKIDILRVLNNKKY